LLTAAAQRDHRPLADVDGLFADLLGRGTRQPAFRLVRDGATLAASAVTRTAGIGNRDLADVIAPNAVIDEYRKGATIVLQGLHHTDPHLARTANNLALDLDHPVQINAYLSPAAAHGLDLHFDYHDVFVVQLGGSKRWRVWEPLERTAAPVKAKHRIALPTFAEVGEPLLDVRLRAGDCLYLPRGFPHAAETVDDESHHLTIGVTAIAWHRVVRRALDAELASGGLSASLPISQLEPGSPPALGALDLDGLRGQISEHVLRHWMAREIWRRQPATRVKPLHSPALSDGPLRFTPGPLLWLTHVGDRAVLGLGDRLLDLPAEALPFLGGLLAGPEHVAATELRGLDDASRVVVLRRLLSEGVLTHG
jgi:bifunctional lysine-specific demethylase and histidyl-hydroxylase NO66